MKYDLISVVGGEHREVTNAELKDGFTMVVASKSDITFEEKKTGNKYTVGMLDLGDILHALNIEICEVTFSHGENSGRGTLVHHGDLIAVNTVIGHDNTLVVRQSQDNMSYRIVGNGISIRPKS